MEGNAIDAVGMVRQIRDELYEKTKDMPVDELIAFYRRRAAATKEKLSQAVSIAGRAGGARTGPRVRSIAVAVGQAGPQPAHARRSCGTRGRRNSGGS